MVEYWLIYDQATGDVIMRGTGPVGSIEQQQVGAGRAIVAVPMEAVINVEIDYGIIASHFAKIVDAEAETIRQRFITPGAGQALEYQEAVLQARACLLDPAGTYPMLQADVAAGTIDPRTTSAVTTQSEAADLVLFMFDQWNLVGASIRRARLGAKVAIAQAANIAEMHEAITIDWQSVLVGGSP